MTKGSTTSVSIGKWTTRLNAPSYAKKPNTLGLSTQQVVLLTGQFLQGGNELVVSVRPAAVDRKLAIRNLNDGIQGRTTRSNTAAREN